MNANRKVRTYDNTTFKKWWEAANDAFVARGLPEPTFGPAHEAYKVGESPETWADYVLHSDLEERSA